MSYRNLEIWKLAREQTIQIHAMSLSLPKFELYETGSQIRRSCKSVRSAIVEGYGRRLYKGDFIRFIIYALSSNDETIDHLETLFETKSFTDQAQYEQLLKSANLLGIKLNRFLQSLIRSHDKPESYR